MTHTTTNPLSRPLVLAAVGCFAAGVVGGAVQYAVRSDVPARHTPGTEAWPQHAVVAAMALVVAAAAARRGARIRIVLAPVSTRAAARLTRTLRGPRAVVAVPLVAMLAYAAGRAGLQVTAGLDPNFTADAWGGPGYLGAMACHYLDCALIAAAVAWLLDRVLLPARVTLASDGALGSPR